MGPMRIGLIAVLLLLGGTATASAATGSAADPSCAEGPTRVGDAIVGTPCDDTIVAPPQVAAVHGGGGDDTIVAAPIAADSPCTGACLHLGVGSQTFDGGPGNDVVFGERGNDRLNGGEGDDRLYGGIGDDLLRGGPGNDLLSGGFGFDTIDGEEGDDFVRGDGTIDEIFNGGGGFDTLSYATGVTPGFTRSTGIAGFPSSSGERGVYIDLEAGIGDNGVAPFGGGADQIEATSFEKVIGTPFSDFIAGTEAGETIDGGGGADAILGRGGDDTLAGGADGDLLDGGGGNDVLQPGPGDSGNAIATRAQAAVSVGILAPEESARPALYLTGGSGDDEVTASYDEGSSDVTFALGPGPGDRFDESASAESGCDVLEPDEAVCELSAPPDAVVLAGMAGDDVMRADGFPDSTAVVELGGEGADSLTGGNGTEDVLVDGPGGAADTLTALGGDDALLHNGGADTRLGGDGNDLFLSNSICDGDLLDGGNDRDNASWAKFAPSGVEANLGLGEAGGPGPGVAPDCGGEPVDHLQQIEDLEATSQGDFLYGDSGNNQLLGRPGPDTYFALGGDDSILANSGDPDLVIDCGEGIDSALIDQPPIVDPVPVGCETVESAEPNNFEPPPLTPKQTAPPAPPVTPPPPVDRKAPTTRLTHHPPKVLTSRRARRRVVFSFASNEPGASFRCGIDRRPPTPCRSPRAYLVGRGAHTVRVRSIDAAGNVDPTPALFRFRVRIR